MKKTCLFVFIMMVVSLCLSQAAWTANLQKQIAAESAVEKIIERGTIKVGMDIFVPWAMKNKKGELIGFEIDVAKKLASDIGVKVEFIPTKWSGIIPALVAGKFDVIIGGMSVTPARNMKINFTRPYYYTVQGVLANKKMTDGFSFADFNAKDITIAARLGSTGAEAAKKVFPKARLRLFDDEPAAVQEVRNGRVHAMVTSQPLPKTMAAESPDILQSFDVTLTTEPISFGIRKGDVDTLNYFNNWIEIVRSTGWVDERYNYWFENDEWKSEL